MKLLAAPVLLLGHPTHSVHAARNDPDTLTSNLVQWVNDNGGFVSDKVAFRHINPDDPSSPRGVFATQEIEEGETIATIPWELIIKDPKHDERDGKVGGWSKDDCGVIREVMKAITAAEDEMTPYGKYLLAQPQNYTVGFWSKEGQKFFEEMTDNYLPPIDIDDMLIWEYQYVCEGDINDPVAVQATMLVRARSDWEYMVPIYGEMNYLFVR
jgi:hypothetical protein